MPLAAPVLLKGRPPMVVRGIDPKPKTGCKSGAAVGRIEKRRMAWPPKSGETEKL